MDPEKIMFIERTLVMIYDRLDGRKICTKSEARQDVSRALDIIDELRAAFPPCKFCSVAMSTPTDGMCDICREKAATTEGQRYPKKFGFPPWLIQAMNERDGTYKP